VSALTTPETAASLVSAEDVTVRFPSRAGELVAVDDASLSIRGGEILGLVGESGSGKSTLARCISGLLSPTSGRIVLHNDDVTTARSRAQRRMVQIVFQDPYSSLNPRLSVRSILLELLRVHGISRGAEAERRCRELVALVGLPGRSLDAYPNSFSGGQRQRIAVARALAVEPELLVADEPTSALDVSVQATILALFEELRSQLGLAILMISHNLAAIRHLCDHIAVMYLGRIIEIGSRDEIFADPRHPYTVALLAASPRIHGDVGAARTRLAGEPPSPANRPPGCHFHPRCPRAEAICSLERPELAPAAGTNAIAACHFRDERRSP
jgi:oligopeptide/dipeptide ABC transporter ATP-binding protein